MGFLKEFVMKHPIISAIIAFSIADRVEDEVMMRRAMKNGMNYSGHRWKIGPTEKPETTETTDDDLLDWSVVKVKDGDT